jgi:hypothetical protein
MAKSFKNSLPVPAVVPDKYTSERDFFDLVEEVAPGTEPLLTQPLPVGPLHLSNPPDRVASPVSGPPILRIADPLELDPSGNTRSAAELIGNTNSKDNNRPKQLTRNNPLPSNTSASTTTTTTTTGRLKITDGADSTGTGITRDATATTSAPGNLIPELVPQLGPAEDSLGAVSGDTRQTFVLSRAHLERLRDYVHDRRSKGDYLYSQKQALQEALDLLLVGCKLVPRPQEVREWEQQRRANRHRGQQ